MTTFRIPSTYSEAVAAGYSGTLEQFRIDLKRSAEAASMAESQAQMTISKANEAAASAALSESYASQASQKASEATVAAQFAETSKDSAVEAKEQAIYAMNDAVSAKSSAESAANDAKTYKNEAEIYKNTANAKADEAAISATGAENAKSYSENYKESALRSAESASNSSESAATMVQDCATLKAQSQAIYESILQIVTISVGHAYNIGVTISGNVVSISFTDPKDNIREDGSILAKWKKTRLLWKSNGFPENENDGTILLDNTIRDQYRNTPFTYDMGVNSNYGFALFTQTTGGVWNASETAPRFSVNLISFATIKQMVKTGVPLSNIGLNVGGVVNIQTSSRFPDMRWMLIDEHYAGVSGADSLRTSYAVFMPEYLFCEAGTDTALTMQYDAPENAYGLVAHDTFANGWTYYRIIAGEYVVMEAGTDYNVGDQISSVGYDVFTKNHSSRPSWGSNRWKTSNIRQWLNSSGTGWYSAQTNYDRLSTSSPYSSGFLTGMNEDFIELIEHVYNGRNLFTEPEASGGDGGGKEFTLDRFWLPSRTEVFGYGSEGMQFDYYKNMAITEDQRRKCGENGTFSHWWLSSASTDNGYYVGGVTATGTESSYLAFNSYGLAPAFCI